MSGRFRLLETSHQRIRTVIADIEMGSEPRFAFYALLLTSALIACIGLVSNSTAVIIGAMLVSPLMTPIFGIAVAMLRGDTVLFWRALSAEALGVGLAIGSAVAFGFLPLELEATPAMLARTEPNLLDLLVAVLAGFAGAFALVDERVSPALPGVAIATATVPPLSNTGLCISLGAYDGALGSFLLFVANFFAILVIGALTFVAAGMTPGAFRVRQGNAWRSFALAVIGFMVVAIFLTQSLLVMVERRREGHTIDRVIRLGLSQFELPPLTVTDILRQQSEEKLQIVATVRSSEIVPPEEVTALQDALQQELRKPVELIVRTLLARDVAAIGSLVEAVEGNLDGRLIQGGLTREERRERIAEQLLREELSSRLGFELASVEYSSGPPTAAILATLQTAMPVGAAELRDLQATLRNRLDDPTLDLVLRSFDSTISTAHERYLVEWTSWDSLTTEEMDLLPVLREIVVDEVQVIPGVFCIGVHVNDEEQQWRVLAEVVGTRAPTTGEVGIIQDAVRARFRRPVEIHVWFKAEAVISVDGHAAFHEFTRSTRKRRAVIIPEFFREKVPVVALPE